MTTLTFGKKTTKKTRRTQNHQVELKAKYDLCNADCVGSTSRHLHQRVEEHKRSVNGNHVREQNGNEPCDIAKIFRVLRKFDCYIAGVFFRYSAPIHWLVHGHMTSNNETVSRQIP